MEIDAIITLIVGLISLCVGIYITVESEGVWWAILIGIAFTIFGLLLIIAVY